MAVRYFNEMRYDAYWETYFPLLNKGDETRNHKETIINAEKMN